MVISNREQIEELLFNTLIKNLYTMPKKEKKPMCPQCLGNNTKGTEKEGYCYDCHDDWETVES